MARNTGHGKGGGAGARKGRAGGFTLLELLLSMTILSIVVVGMADLFSFTARSWAGQVRTSTGGVDVHDAADQIRIDLESAFPGRAVPHAYVDPGAVTNELLRRNAVGRMLLPFEIDRASGLGLERSFQRADPDPRFSRMAFVGIQPGASSRLPETFFRGRHGGFAEAAPVAVGPSPDVRPTPSDACLVGYYVAYTRDSPFRGDDVRRSMKLYRHFRPSGTSLGQAQAGSTIRHVADAINRRLIPDLKFGNRDLPFLLAYHAPDVNPAVVSQVTSRPPWPIGSENPPPPGPARTDPAAWFDPAHAIHDHLPGDAPVAGNVVRFRCRPYKRVLDGTVLRVLDGPGLAQKLGLPDAEWPALLVPDFVDVELAVVDGASAAILTRREDWLEDWENEANSSVAARTIRRNVTSLRFRVTLNAFSPES